MSIFDKLRFNKKFSHSLLEKVLDEKDTILINRDGTQIMASSLIGKILEVVECSCGITARKGENGVVFSRGVKPLGLVTDADSYQVLCFKKDLVIIHNRLFKSYDILVSNGLKSIVYSDSEFHSSILLDNGVFYLYYKYKKEDRCISYIVRVSKEEGCRFIEIKDIFNIKLFRGFDGTSLYLMCKEQSKHLLNVCEVLRNKGDRVEVVEWDEYLYVLSLGGVTRAEAFGEHSDYSFCFRVHLDKNIRVGVSYEGLLGYSIKKEVGIDVPLRKSMVVRYRYLSGVFPWSEISEDTYNRIKNKKSTERTTSSQKCNKNEEGVEKVKDSKIAINTLHLNSRQVEEFDKVLFNLKSLLKLTNMLGTASLYEDNGVVYLEVGRNKFYSDGEKFRSTNPNTPNIVLETLTSCVFETIELLVMNIPFKVKRIFFSSDVEKSSSGTVSMSKEEKGSVEVLLR